MFSATCRNLLAKNILVERDEELPQKKEHLGKRDIIPGILGEPLRNNLLIGHGPKSQLVHLHSGAI